MISTSNPQNIRKSTTISPSNPQKVSTKPTIKPTKNPHQTHYQTHLQIHQIGVTCGSRGWRRLGAGDGFVCGSKELLKIDRERRARQILKGRRNELKIALLSYSVSMNWARKEYLL
jgi:hypothetical protein